MTNQQILKLFKFSILILLAIVGIILVLADVEIAQEIGLVFIISKVLGFLLLYFFYKNFPIKIYLESETYIIVTLALSGIVLLAILVSIISFLHSYYEAII
jgi:hypothetical protein